MNILKLQEDLNSQRREKMTYQAIADGYGVHKAVVWRILHDNYNPKDNLIRGALGLDIIIDCIDISGKLLEGSQVFGSKLCIQCERPFAPNTAKRKQCFDCEPFRRRKY
jgi:hypothetical protein